MEMSHLSSGFPLSEAAAAAEGWASTGVPGLDQETAGGVLNRNKNKTEKKNQDSSPHRFKREPIIRQRYETEH